MVSRCLGQFAFLAACADGARVARNRASPQTKFIAGVPVLNYDAAYDGFGVLGELESEKEQEWMVVVNQDTSDSAIESMCKSTFNGCNLVGSPSKGGAPFLELRGTEKDLETLIHSSRGAVRFVEPDQKVYLIPEIESNEDVSAQAATWGLNKVGKDGAAGQGAGTFIYVLDTGVRVSHNEFGGRAVPQLDMTIGRPKECNGDMSCAGDVQGHGTHCAGTAGGATLGVAPAAAVRSIKVLSDQGSGEFSWSVYALNYLAVSSDRPVVASMSLGGQGVLNSQKTAVDAAVSAGVVVVVASGNSNSDACGFTPAFVPSAITVNSMTSQNMRSSFSNYGRCSDIFAPGSDILSASQAGDSKTKVLSGTSMACPHVSGGAALVLEANPSFHSEAVINLLLDKAITDGVGDVKGSPNKLLWVGAGAAPVLPPPAAPSCPDWCGPSMCWYSKCQPCC